MKALLDDFDDFFRETANHLGWVTDKAKRAVSTPAHVDGCKLVKLPGKLS